MTEALVTEATKRWQVGDLTITSIVEKQDAGIPPQFFFPDATAAEVQEHPWLVPDFAAGDGTVSLRVQAFVIERPGAPDLGGQSERQRAGWGRSVLVDPCVGNGKPRSFPFWNEMEFPWLERFIAAGCSPVGVSTVVHTHLHADHVGWDTRLVDGAWAPTFPGARYLYVEAEVDYWRATEQREREDVYADSIAPIFDAGQADLVAPDADLDDGLRLVPTPGHTPGHVSLEIESAGEHAVITGDLLHHPVQLARPEWAEIGDWDAEMARTTRSEFFRRHASAGTLVFGTHFPTHPVGRFVVDGDRWRFRPEPGS